MNHLVKRGLVLLGASAISVGLAAGPAAAGTPHTAPAGTVVQEQSATVSNRTKQTSVAVAPAVQVAPAINVGVLSGGQSIKQANHNDADATAVNLNSTDQRVVQDQHGRAGGGKRPACKRPAGKHPAGKNHAAGKKGHAGKQSHAGKQARRVSQRQSATVSNRTKQTSVAVAPAVQVAPAINVGVLSGGQSIKQANHNDADATAVNLNATVQQLTQGQFGSG